MFYTVFYTKGFKKEKPLDNQGVNLLTSGRDGTRTRDPVRDRHVF